MPICFQVVPEPASSSRCEKDMMSTSDRVWVEPSSSVSSAWASTLIRSSWGCLRRSSITGFSIFISDMAPSRASPSRASRMSRE